MSSKIFSQFLATASRSTPALRSGRLDATFPMTSWGRFLATASRSTPALNSSNLNDSTSDKASNNVQALHATIEQLRLKRREKFFFMSLILSVANFLLVLVTAYVTLKIDQTNIDSKFIELFGDPSRLSVFGAVAVGASIATLSFFTGIMARTITKSAYSRPKLNDDGIDLKQETFNVYLSKQIKSFNGNPHESVVVHKIFTNHRGIIYELSQKDNHVLVVERTAKEGKVLSIGKGRVHNGDIRVTFKVIDGSEARADLKYTDKSMEELEGTFRNVTYDEFINGRLVAA